MRACPRSRLLLVEPGLQTLLLERRLLEAQPKMELLETALDLGLGGCLSLSLSLSLSLTAGRRIVELAQLCDQHLFSDERSLQRRTLCPLAREELLLLTQHAVE